MNVEQDSQWIVIKLGGSSTASKDCWENALRAIEGHRDAGLRVLVVHSALAGVTDLLESALAASAAQRGALMEALRERHRLMADALGVKLNAGLGLYLQEVESRLGEDDAGHPKQRARVLASGELMASELVRELFASKPWDASVLDARDWLRSDDAPGCSVASRYLSAVCDTTPGPDWRDALAAQPGILVSQGFIARDSAGDTVLLGRGGSDTSAAYFAAGLDARALEIWTDVPGLFTANPHDVPGARLLRSLDYAEAQEIATSGAKVLHPRCIRPLRQRGIPIRIVCAQDPTLPGTCIGPQTGDSGGRVKAIPVRHGVTLVNMETLGMWHQAGFLADAFAAFKRHGLSIDMISTSETSVTVSLDPLVNAGAEQALQHLVEDLQSLCRTQVTHHCAAISLVGRQVRANLHRLAPAFELFQERQVHMVSQAANDLNLTFVVNEQDAVRLVKELHTALIHKTEDDALLGPSWEELRAPQEVLVAPWWHEHRAALLTLAAQRSPVYVYHRASIGDAARQMHSVGNVDQVYFAMKANCHPDVLQVVNQQGLGFECVSPGEIAHLRSVLPDLHPERILYTPNFAPRQDYELGLQAGVWVTLDNLHPLKAWPELFKNHDILLRVDPGLGAGHHSHVRTAGTASKFGIVYDELGEARQLAHQAGARIVGLHMHLGSGILDAQVWKEQGLLLAHLAADFPDVRILDLGGGLGIAEKPGDLSLDIRALDQALQAVKRAAPQCELWLEPGRFLVARAGVLLTRVTQLKGKGAVRYVGADTGMNSLIRPALYGAHHPIVNLTRLDQPASGTFNVVGPICESGDILGRERRLPEPQEGDVLLIANAGAYGRVMASHYNLREPAAEVVL